MKCAKNITYLKPSKILSGRNISFKEYKNIIFEEKRLVERLTIFAKYQLPSFAIAARKHNLFYHVAASAYLPDAYKRVLRLAESRYPFLHIDFYDECQLPDLRQIYTAYLLASNFSRASLCLARIDDDDILHPLFFDKMQNFMDECFTGFAVTFPSLYYGLFKNGRYSCFSKMNMIFTAVGLSYISLYDKGKIITEYVFPPGDHTKIDTVVPTISLNNFCSGIYTVHGNNASLSLARRDKIDLEQFIKRYFSKPEPYDEIDKYFYNIFTAESA